MGLEVHHFLSGGLQARLLNGLWFPHLWQNTTPMEAIPLKQPEFHWQCLATQTEEPRQCKLIHSCLSIPY